jgi:hypothetical protein
MAKYDDCISVLLSDSRFKDMKTADKQEIVASLGKQVEAQKLKLKDQELEESINKWLHETSDAEQIKIAVEQRSKLLNLQAERKLDEYLKGFNDKGIGINVFLGGHAGLEKGSSLSVDSWGKAVSQKYQTSLIKALEDNDLMEEFTSGAIDSAIIKELYQIKPGGNPGITGNKSAEGIAKIINQLQSDVIDNLNRHGSWIRKLPGYIMRQSHNPIKIRRAGYDTWRKMIDETIDHERVYTQLGVLDGEVEQFWKSVWLSLQSGTHFKHKLDQADDVAQGFSGPGNLAKRMSTAHRSLHFKDAESFMKYNSEFGSRNIRENIILSLEFAGRDIALLQRLGTNPKNMLLKKLGQLYKKAKKEGDLEAMKSLEKRASFNASGAAELKGMTKYIFNEVDGTTRIPGNMSVAQYSQTMRNVQNMSKLGMATISSVADIPNAVAELRYQGMGYFDAWGTAFENIFKGRGKIKSQRREIALALGVGFDGMIGNSISRFSANDLAIGHFSKAQQVFFKLNALSWWTDSHRVGSTFMMANNLGNNANKLFSELDPALQRILRKFEIEDAEWDIYRKYSFIQEEGKKFIITDRDSITDSAIRQYIMKKEGVKKVSKSKIERYRDDLETRLRAYYTDRADFATPMPGAVERAIMNVGTQDGDAMGTALRFFWQFKSFPLTIVRKGAAREAYGYGAKNLREALTQGKSVAGLAHLIVATSAMGYMAMYLKDIIRGRSPRKLTGDYKHNVKIIAAAMSQGGGLGLYGDFLFGQVNKYGGSFLDTFAGPTFGQLNQVQKIWNKTIQGDDPFPTAAKWVQGNAPFINLFYLRMALDYLILYNLSEWSNPGYLQRMEKRMKKDYNQEFYIKPSRVIKKGGTLNLPEILMNMGSETFK